MGVFDFTLLQQSVSADTDWLQWVDRLGVPLAIIVAIFWFVATRLWPFYSKRVEDDAARQDKRLETDAARQERMVTSLFTTLERMDERHGRMVDAFIETQKAASAAYIATLQQVQSEASSEIQREHEQFFMALASRDQEFGTLVKMLRDAQGWKEQRNQP